MSSETAQHSKPLVGEKQLDLLETLSNAIGVSGCEDEIRRIVIDAIKLDVDEYRIDAMGNILAVKHARSSNALRVMFAAHMDEVGFMLVEDSGEGIFAFERVGGIDERQLVSKQIVAGSNHISGIIGSKPIHLSSLEEIHHSVSVESMRIDVSPANAGKLKVGDYATFATKFQRNGGSLFGKALDDRLGVASLIELTKKDTRNLEILFAFTVQEEIGLRGARIAAFDFKPDMAFVIDSTPAHDFPAIEEGTENSQYNCRLGEGPAIYLSDAGTISDPRLIRFLVKIAEENHIPYQFRQPGGGGTDAGAIHLTGTGIPIVSISVPGRYAHSPIMHAKIKDWENTLALLDMILKKVDRSILSVDR